MSKAIQEHILGVFSCIFFLLLAFFLGRSIGLGQYYSIILISLVFYCILIFKKPEFAILILAILIPNMFRIIDPDLFRIVGLFKLRDILLIVSFLPLILREFIVRKDLKFIFGSISAKAIILFSFFILLLVTGTALRHDFSFNLSFRIARDYFYYLFFFGAVACIRTKQQLDFILKGMIVVSLIFALMYVLQSVGGGVVEFFPGERIAMKYAGVQIGRSYISFGFVEPLVFAVVSLIGFISSKKIVNRLMWIVIPLLLSAKFFTLGRTSWVITIIGMALIVFLSPWKNKRTASIRIVKVAGIFAGYLLLISLFRYGTATVLIKGGLIRGKEGIYEISSYLSGIINPNEGGFVYKSERERPPYLLTLSSRTRKFELYYENIVKKNPLFGMGFLYPGVGVTEDLPYSNIVITDCPLISILNTMGFVGLLCYILLYVAFIKRGFFILSRIKNPIYKSFILGFIVWYIADWFGVMTGGSLLRYDMISIKALCVGLTESIYKVESELKS